MYAVQCTYGIGVIVIYRPQKDKRLSWPSWLTCSGRFTHIVVTRRLQAERQTVISLAKDRHSANCATQPTYQSVAEFSDKALSVCMSQLSDDGLTAQFLAGADQCLGEMLFLSLETVEDCELKVVDCSEELHAARQLRSPVKLLRSPMKVSLYLSLVLCCISQSSNKFVGILPYH